MSDTQRALVNRMIEEIQNKKNLGLIEEIFSEDFFNHTPVRGIATDRDGMRQLFALTHVAFPDGIIVVNDQAAVGDRVWTRKTFSGTHTGPLGDAAPSGKKVTYTVFDILSVKDGRIVEHWGLADRLSLLRQLDIIKL